MVDPRLDEAVRAVATALHDVAGGCCVYPWEDCPDRGRNLEVAREVVENWFGQNDPELLAEVKQLRAFTAKAREVCEHVSRGRSGAFVGIYPDATARAALGLLREWDDARKADRDA